MWTHAQVFVSKFRAFQRQCLQDVLGTRRSRTEMCRWLQKQYQNSLLSENRERNIRTKKNTHYFLMSLHSMFQSYDGCIGKRTNALAGSPCFNFLNKVVAWSFIVWNEHLSVANLCWEFSNPTLIHDFSLTIFLTNKSHPHSCLNTATWAHEKKSQELFLGIFEQITGNIAKHFWEQTRNLHGSKQTAKKKKNGPGTFHGTLFLTWHKAQVSAMFPRTFPGIETASSWDLCPACQGPGRGWKLPRRPLDNQRSSLDDYEYLSCLLAMLAHSFWLAQSQTPTNSRPICWCKTPLFGGSLRGVWTKGALNWPFSSLAPWLSEATCVPLPGDAHVLSRCLSPSLR